MPQNGDPRIAFETNLAIINSMNVAFLSGQLTYSVIIIILILILFLILIGGSQRILSPYFYGVCSPAKWDGAIQ